MTETIAADIEQLRHSANQIEQYMVQMDAELLKVDGMVEDIKSSWLGEASTNFRASYANASQTTLKEWRVILQNLIAELRAAASELEAADNQTL